MRLVVDTNLLISALLVRRVPPSSPVGGLAAWTLHPIDRRAPARRAPSGSRATQGKQAPAARIGRGARQPTPGSRGRVDKLPPVDISPDPFDNFLLAIAQQARQIT